MSKLLTQCKEIFELQEAMNVKVNPNWKEANYAWKRAAWIESAELADHYGYKWWKNIDQPVNQEQAGLELVDILHFMVSEMISGGFNYSDLANWIHQEMENKPNSEPSKEKKLKSIDEFASNCAAYNISPYLFMKMVNTLGFDINWILTWYLGKNALNTFRQDNGYKAGTYIKVWNGREDNEYLADVINSGAKSFKEIYDGLGSFYPK